MGVALVIAAGIAVLIAGVYLSPDATTRRKLKRAQRYPIADLPESTLGRVVGTARPIAETLTAPLTGRSCVMYLVNVDEERSSGKSSTWRNVIREFQCVPFILEDGTGRALVEPRGAEISLEVDAKSTSGTFDNPTPVEEAFLARHQEKGQGFLGFNRRLRYRESIIEVGEQVAILGQGVREPDPDAPPTDAYRGDQPTRLRLTSSVAYPLVISDAPETTR